MKFHEKEKSVTHIKSIYCNNCGTAPNVETLSSYMWLILIIKIIVSNNSQNIHLGDRTFVIYFITIHYMFLKKMSVDMRT